MWVSGDLGKGKEHTHTRLPPPRTQKGSRCSVWGMVLLHRVKPKITGKGSFKQPACTHYLKCAKGFSGIVDI